MVLAAMYEVHFDQGTIHYRLGSHVTRLLLSLRR